MLDLHLIRPITTEVVNFISDHDWV